MEVSASAGGAVVITGRLHKVAAARSPPASGSSDNRSLRERGLPGL